MIDIGIDLKVDFENMDFIYGENVSGPEVEIRKLDAIRSSLKEPECDGPEDVYAIAMDVYENEDKTDLIDRDLLFGIVTYAKGKLGKEPIRSQGHIHAVSPSCNMSTGELYEIWTGQAIIYMQELGTDDPGKCYAIVGNPGDKVLVPPGWVHATVSSNPEEQLTFGAWCVRDFGFDYKDVRAHHGIAHFPEFDQNELIWVKNPHYNDSTLEIRGPRKYEEFNIDERPIYTQFKEDKDKFLFISKPNNIDWSNFRP